MHKQIVGVGQRQGKKVICGVLIIPMDRDEGEKPPEACVGSTEMQNEQNARRTVGKHCGGLTPQPAALADMTNRSRQCFRRRQLRGLSPQCCRPLPSIVRVSTCHEAICRSPKQSKDSDIPLTPQTSSSYQQPLRPRDERSPSQRSAKCGVLFSTLTPDPDRPQILPRSPL